MAEDDETSETKLYLPELVRILNRMTWSDITSTPLALTDTGSEAVITGAGTLMIFRSWQREDQDIDEWAHLDNLEGNEWLALFGNI